MANWITAIAAAIAAVATVAYFIATVLIFRETKKSADAAKKSADAADKSADAAQQSIALVRQQLEERARAGAFLVTDTIDLTASAIEEMLKSSDLFAPNVAGSLPRIRAVLDQRAEGVLNNAAPLRQDAAKELSSAFDSLRTGLSAYEHFHTRFAHGYTMGSPDFTSNLQATRQPFERALAHLRNAKQALSGAPPPSAP
jgi:hypothetical protein